MRLILFGTLLCLAAGTAKAAPDVTGHWLTEDRMGVIAISRCGASLCGRIARTIARDAKAPKTDINNPDPALRNRPFVGLQILSGFREGRTAWENGRIYDPKSGRTYRSNLRLNRDGSLKVSGCVAIFCLTQRWTRVRA